MVCAARKQMFEQARQLSRKEQSEQVTASMREVAQIAEDARATAVKRAQEPRPAQK